MGDGPAAANLKAALSIPVAANVQRVPANVQPQQVRDAEEQDVMDSLPLDDDFFSAEEFSSGNSSVVNDTDSANDDESVGSNISVGGSESIVI